MSQLSNALSTIPLRPLDQKISSFEVQNYHCQSASLRFITYSRHLRTTHEKISTGFWIQILWQKHTQNYSSKMSWVHLGLFKVHLNLKNHQKTPQHQFFSSESWDVALFKFYIGRTPGRTPFSEFWFWIPS